MPADLKWTNLEQKGTVPPPRSGHSLTYVGKNNYIMYGGIVDAVPGTGNKIQPTGDLYSMKITHKYCAWEQEKGSGDETPPSRAQHVALSTPENDHVFIFGGHANPTTRLNDTWWLKVADLTWKRAEGDNAVESNQESKIGAPPPRANCGSCFYKGRYYIYGGHGGLNYARVAFSDIYTFDIETNVWEKIEAVQGQAPLPEGRGGHSIFIVDDKLYSYGGWNSETMFNNVIVFDLNTKEWSDPDIYNDAQRWNHSAIMVEAIPSWKYFIFGGEITNYHEGHPRTFGECDNTSYYLDIETMKWTAIVPEDDIRPPCREYAAMAYDSDQSRLLVFGGWNSGWLQDMFALNVSKIVGPSYAITEIDPPLSQLSGAVPVVIKGCGFKDVTIKVYFTCGKNPTDVPNKQSIYTSGVFISETEIHALTPNFKDFGPKEAVVQLMIATGDLTTTWVPFSFFLNTRANKSLCHGTGLFQDQAVGAPIEFIIQARNDQNENRKSGRDDFQVKIVTKGDVPREIAAEIDDHNDGQYYVKYQVEEECEVQISVLFKDESGSMVPVRGSPYSASFNANTNANANNLTGPVMTKHITKQIENLQSFMKDTAAGASTKDKDFADVKTLIEVKDHYELVFNTKDSVTLQLDQLEESLKLLQQNGIAKDSQIKASKRLFDEFVTLNKLARTTKQEIAKDISQEMSKNNSSIQKLEEELKQFTGEMKKRVFYKYDCGREAAQEKLNGVYGEITDYKDKIEDLGFNAGKFGNPALIDTPIRQVENIEIEVGNMKVLWDHISNCQQIFSGYMENTWAATQPFEMEDDVKKLQKTLKEMKVDKRCNAYIGILEEIKKWLMFLPLIAELSDPSMRERHWDAIREKVQKQFTVDDSLLLRDVYNLNLVDYREDVEEITEQARQEAKMEINLQKLQDTWVDVEFEFNAHKGSDVQLMKLSEENFEMLEENQVMVTGMTSSRYLATFETDVTKWQKNLGRISEVYQIIGEVQRTWTFLENLFIHSDEVRKELPEESDRFIGIDAEVRKILKDGVEKKNANIFCNQDYVLPALEDVQKQLTICEKALNDFMSSKRRSFPRFYFVSPTDLLDILSNGSSPAKIMVHMPKIFQAIDTLELKEEGVRPAAIGMHSCVGKEYVPFTDNLKLLGKVENYLQDVIDIMRKSLNNIAGDSLKRFGSMKKDDWLKDDPAQITLLINLMQWCIAVENGFEKVKTDPTAMKTALSEQIVLLKNLIIMVQGDLDKPMRQKIMCMITMDAHSRDIIDKLNNAGVTSGDDFQWQSQLKAYWDADKKDFQERIADASFWYGYEYLGNGPRLVVTPLTDRIYVTATQALHLKMGCAPAGPAGTGKTETTKDLSSALAKAVYVFNCSDQMDYQGMGQIFMGLAASGSWGCFDEFNRLIPEVLSVCSVQFKSVTDAIKQQKSRFVIQDTEIALDPTCGAFITMNPGYLGRSELPEGLKALFRPITVVVPDLELICENMLMAEGFVEAKGLAKKFTTLYFLCKDLLSAAKHYDWGLRAIKSVLVVAGAFKRQEPHLPEGCILMRALRDFNTPKIVAEDLIIFTGLLDDLFPGIDVPRKRNMEFESVIQKTITAEQLYGDEEFVLKVVQLREMMEIRHCVFVMGPPGSGKSSTWKVLAKSNDRDGLKTTVVDLNPKVVSTNELYGVVHFQTRDWIDGLMSKTMRTLGQVPDTNPKWIILDGDLDANWIESMNSVMDDNKILTLASNERIVLKPHMRLIFEIRDLNHATPATVSRAGILFISDATGYQWKSYVKSWIAARSEDTADRKEQLQNLFDKYIEESLWHIKRNFKYTVPVVDISLIISICKLLEAVLKTNEVSGLEYIFVFACIWCMGGGLSEKDAVDYRKLFSNWWKDKWKFIKFSKGSVFDYYVDLDQSRLEEWSKLNTKDMDSVVDTSKSISNYTIPTVDTISTQYLMKKFIEVGHSPLLVGSAGCGKTQITKGLLNELVANGDEYLQQIVNFNNYTDSTLLQTILEQQLEKKVSSTYAPIGKFKLIYFVDDLNMPELDTYNTQTAIALVRQHKDYGHWYDRTKLMLKKIKNTLYVGAMNPTAGSFFVNPRLQRHFSTIAIPFPETSSLYQIYSCFLNKHFQKFKGTVNELLSTMIKSTISLHGEVSRTFRKTAVNFHYEFNVRHLTNIFQGLLVAKQEAIKEPDQVIRLWVHECERIFGDRLVNAENLTQYRGLIADICKKNFAKFNLTKFFQPVNTEPLIFAYFVGSLDDKLYDQFPNIDALSGRLREALREYNDTNPVMDLVLFEDAMKHVCKVSRIVSADGGHALLVGVGGSGKQSLSRLSSFICMFTTVSIVISSTYGMNDLKMDLQKFYMKSGVKDEGLLFLLNEGQITKERFLVYINDLLSSGEIADLFPAEDQDTIINNIRPAVKGEGLIDNRDNCWKFFIERVRKNLHMALCFSPVGESFRGRSRKFPALVNCTVIDWFHPWPEDALLSVAQKFLEEVEIEDDDVRTAIINFMPYSFKVVNECSDQIFDQERRFVYTTPKSFLELIKLFKAMLTKKNDQLEAQREKYETGVVKLTETAEIVSKLEENLKISSIEVEAAKKTADEQAAIVGVEKEKVEEKNDIATAENKKCAKIAEEVSAKSAKVQAELDMALPLVEQAKQALAGLKVKDLQMLKALANPPADVARVFHCVLHLFAKIDDLVPVDAKGRLKTENPWKTSLLLMKQPEKLLESLNAFKGLIDAEQVPPKNFDAIRPTLADEGFNPKTISTKSQCASGLCDWIINITQYFDVVISVEPKKQAVRDAQETLASANAKKEEMEELVADLNAKLAVLQAAFQKAMDEKYAAETQAAKCERQLDLAQRLVNALGAESVRWAESIITLGDAIAVVTGDVLLASSFVSYVGPFNKKFRDVIVQEKFVTFFEKNKIPVSAAKNPLSILTDEAEVAVWNNQKLPSDRVSTENGAILTNSDRYSLIIDPQLQGITWLKEREKEHNLQVTRLSNNKMIKTIEAGVEQGFPVLIENLQNSIDAVIQPVYARAIIKKGKSRFIRLGDKELHLHNNFNLYLHTKLSNPHYPPEIQAECTLINFTVTEAGLEDQLLSLVVKKERPELAQEKEDLIQQQNNFKITLRDLEAGLLRQLAESEGDILENIALIENLEKSKALSSEIQEKVAIAKETEILINDASEVYRPAASRGALVFFMMNELYKIHSFYKFSLDSFVIVVNRAIDIVAERLNPKKPEPAELKEGEEAEAKEEASEGEGEEDGEMSPKTLKARVEALLESITYQAFDYTRRGTLERHKLIVSTMLCLRINVRKGLIIQSEVDALVKKEVALEAPQKANSLEFIPDANWAAVKGLESVKIFENLIVSMTEEALQWRKWFQDERSEAAELPRAFKDLDLFHRLLLLRALRPDRLSPALVQYVTECMGEQFIEQPAFNVFQMYKEMNTETPVFFMLFPGVDPTNDVEQAGKANGKLMSDGTLVNISMGQGQEKPALEKLAEAGKKGNWVMFQNVHLMQTWMKDFERALEVVIEEGAHPDFRCFVSSEPPPLPMMEIVPESILQNSIKIANEAPQDLKANLRRALNKFDDDHFERAKSHKLPEFKALLFGLCMFHSLILGRRKFGSQGWSRHYNFNDGDLTICGDVLHNYLTKYDKVPYDDLRYIYGEIMYGGHITDGWDRRTNNAYLEVLIRPEILQQMQLTLAPGFKSPDPFRFDREMYRKYIEEKLPTEQPQMFGLHPNAEIGYLTFQGETLFQTILSVSGGSGTGGGADVDTVSQFISTFLGQLPSDFPMLDLKAKVKDPNPYTVVCIQECERMNNLLQTIRISLTELEAGLKGLLNITDLMENLSNSLNINVVPASWAAVAYFSKKSLTDWFGNMLERVTQLVNWAETMETPPVLWISGLFNPMSFLTAVMQVTARANNLPLDDMFLKTDVQNSKDIAEYPTNAEVGAYVNGFFLEGAGWEYGRNGEQGYLTDMVLKDLHPELPVVHVTAIRRSERKTVAMYQCPVYVTSMRGPTYVFCADLQMESEETDPNKWILAGCALLMNPE